MEQYLDIYAFEEYHSSSKKKLPYVLGYSNYLEACEYIKSRDNEANDFKAQVLEKREDSKKKYNEFKMSIKSQPSEPYDHSDVKDQNESKKVDDKLQALETSIKNMNEMLKLILENTNK